MATSIHTILNRFPFLRGKATIAVLTLLGAYNIGYVATWLNQSSQPPFDDFFALWSWGKFALTHGSAIYDPEALEAFQHMLDPALPGMYPYLYPPIFMLMLAPFAMMPLAPAYMLWLTSTFLLYDFATLGRDWKSIHGAALLVAPTTLLAVVAGHNGFLTAALLIGGLRSLKRFPVIGGVLFGLLAYKPQFSLMVPVVLLASRQWRAIIAVIMTVTIVVVSSSAAFGWTIWLIWLESTSLYQKLLWANQADLYHLMPTVMANFHLMGTSRLTGYLAQAVTTTIVIIFVWREFSRDVDDKSIAAATVGTLLATPYAYTYDMPMITAALVIEWRRRKYQGIRVKLWEAIVVLYLCLAIFSMTAWTIPFAAPVLFFVIFWMIVRGGNLDMTTKNQSELPFYSDATS